MNAAPVVPVQAALAVLLLAACGDADTSAASDAPAVRIDTIGDTITVHTTGPGAWGAPATLEPRVTIGSLDGPPETVFGRVTSIAVGPGRDVYVLDGQAAEIRVFDESGEYLRTIGRRGEGPGEMQQPGGLAIFPDGAIGVRDPRNARLQVWSADGTETDEWPVVSSRFYSSGTPLWVDDRGTAWIFTAGASEDRTRPTPRVIVRVDRQGDVVDTLPDPGDRMPPNEVTASNPERGTLSSSMGVPYLPTGAWAVHPDGSLLRTTLDGIGIEVVAPDGGVRRITRAFDPVPVPAAERGTLRDRIVESMRNTDPSWSWNGPDIPEMKPHIRAVYPALDGRIWALVSAPSREEPYPYHDPEDPDSPETYWTQSPRFEVYERDGAYVGRVDVEPGPTGFGSPVFLEDGAWGVTLDELGVQRVVRYELVRPE